jgi:hypothetical protein
MSVRAVSGSHVGSLSGSHVEFLSGSGVEFLSGDARLTVVRTSSLAPDTAGPGALLVAVAVRVRGRSPGGPWLGSWHAPGWDP